MVAGSGRKGAGPCVLQLGTVAAADRGDQLGDAPLPRLGALGFLDGPHVLALEAIGQPVERGAGLGAAVQRVGDVRRLGRYPRLGVEPEADLDHVAFGDPAGGAVGCADAGS